LIAAKCYGENDRVVLALHERIRSEIEGKILSGALVPGDKLPTEHALMAEYKCARMTVNKALSALATAGLIDRRKRAGSFIARPRLHSMVLDIPDLMQEVLLRRQAYRFELLNREIGKSKAKKADSDFDLGSGRILTLFGLHYADDRALAFEQRHVSLKSVPAIEQASFESEPPGTWLLHHIPWTEAETRISARAADAYTASLLHLEVGAPLLQIERQTWRGTDRITFVRQLFRADAYDLSARFKAQETARR
jgi:GntR family transcriptional regulator, histidine utilization repressor